VTPPIDLKGLKCPLPVLRTQKILRSLPLGSEITVLITDPASTIDMPHYCKTSGNELLSQNQDEGTFIFVIKKTAETIG
jgi:tRNA 2-thiouridine synthesizing protein A